MSEAAERHLRLADAARAAGDLEGALSHYERCLAWRLDTPRARTLADDLRGRRGAGRDHPTLALPAERLGEAARRYRLLREIGRGGAGTVYLADDARLGRRVALKVLHPRPDRAARALLEAQAAAALAHPGVVRIYDVVPAQRVVVMEHLAGGSLRERLPPGTPLAPRAAALLVGALCEIVEAVHRRGLVHGDLKPGNVLFRPDRRGLGRPVLADFGLARVRATTGAGAVGTLAYMAPEVRAGAAPGPAADLYALGVLLYEILTGAPPHARARLLSGERLPPPPLPGSIPSPLRALARALLAERPGDRPPSAAEVGARLAEAGGAP